MNVRELPESHETHLQKDSLLSTLLHLISMLEYCLHNQAIVYVPYRTACQAVATVILLPPPLPSPPSFSYIVLPDPALHTSFFQTVILPLLEVEHHADAIALLLGGLHPLPVAMAGPASPVDRPVEAVSVAVHVERVRPSLHVPAQPDHAEQHKRALHHRESHEVTPRPHLHRARRRGSQRPPIDAPRAAPRRPRLALRQRRDNGMRPTEHKRQPKQPHLVHQTQPALELTTRHPATLMLAAPRRPQPRLVRDSQHLRRSQRASFWQNFAD